MKKSICLLLSLQLILAMAVPAFSAEDSAQPEPQVTDPAPEGTEFVPVAEDCSHNWNEGSVTEPGCTTEGKLVSVCTLCNEIREQTLPATGHSFDTMNQLDAANHKRICSVCGAEETQPHTWDGGKVTREPACKTDGERIFTCGCGETRKETIAAGGHSFGEWTKKDQEQHIRSCSGCDETELEDHSWKEEVIAEATCKKTGSTRKTCTVCGYNISVITEKLKEHTYENECDPDCDVCGEKRNAKHEYGNSWSRDNTGHWHECVKCGEKTDFKKHYPGPAATEEEPQVCITCDYVIQEALEHTHDFDTKWETDEKGHWHICEGCDEERDYAKHVYDGVCDERCDICEYENESAHDFTDEWLTNDKNHWKVCTVCGEKKLQEAHIPGEEATEEQPQLCTVCGFELAPIAAHTHDFSARWEKDENSHWKVCECGEASVPFAHSWDEGEKGSKNRIVYTCTDCGQERMEITSGFPWWIPVLLILLVLAAGGAAAYFFLILPKEQDGKFARK